MSFARIFVQLFLMGQKVTSFFCPIDLTWHDIGSSSSLSPMHIKRNTMIENEPEVKQKQNANNGCAFSNGFKQWCNIGWLFLCVDYFLFICFWQTVDTIVFSFILCNIEKVKDNYSLRIFP